MRGKAARKTHYAYVPLSKECKRDLEAVQASLSTHARGQQLRRSGIQGLHFTLGVFRLDKRRKDETDEDLINSVNQVLKEFLDERPPIDLTFGDLGNFGSRIVFIRLTNEQQLTSLREDVNDLLKREGVHVTDERFTPHVTLYRGDAGGGGIEAVRDMVKRTDLPPVTASPATQILFEKLSS